MNVEVQEVVPKCQTRTEMGRIVVAPPKVASPLKHRTTGSFFMCCSRAFLTEESYNKHLAEKEEHDEKPLDFSKFPRTPLQPERKALYGPSSPKYWMARKTSVVRKVFEDSDKEERIIEQSDAGETRECGKVIVEDVDNSQKGTRPNSWKRCSICKLKTDSMARHMRNCHSNGKYKCLYCPCTFVAIHGRRLHQVRMHRVKGPSSSTHSPKKNAIKPAPSGTSSLMHSQRKNANKPTPKNVVDASKLVKDILIEAKKNKTTECPLCGKVLSSPLKLREHLYSHYRLNAYKCRHCKMGFNYSTNLLRHERAAHSASSRYFCDICQAGFMSSTTLLMHKRRVHLNQTVRRMDGMVPYSSKSFKRSSHKPVALSINQKLPLPNNSGMYECRLCEKKLSTPQGWRGHMLIHQNMKPYKCDLCGISFRLHGTRHGHIKKCHTNGPFKCQYCCCTFNEARGRDRHAKLYHSKSFTVTTKPADDAGAVATVNEDSSDLPSTSAQDSILGYRCNLCGLIVKLLSDFNNHKTAHSNVHERQCNLCLKEFPKRSLLQRHKEIAHSKGIHKCQFCCCEYKHTRGLCMHLTREHGMQRDDWDFTQSCLKPGAARKIQQKSYDQNISTKGNTKGAKESLKVTDEVTSTSQLDDIGMNESSERQIQCDLCMLKVKSLGVLRVHKVRSHNNNGKFKCPDCTCTFITPTSLQMHRVFYHGLVGVRNTKKRRFMAAAGVNNSARQLKPSGKLSYMCTHCEETFLDQETYRKHVQTHQTRTEMYSCDLCNLKFKFKSSILNHKWKSHFHKGKFQCTQCTCKFLTAAGLINHRKCFHGYTAKRLRTSASRRHVKLKMQRKNSQRGSVSKAALLVRHKYIHTQISSVSTSEPMQCPQCFKQFSTIDNLRKHIDSIHNRKDGEKKYECDLCNIKFLHPDSVHAHKKSCHYHDGQHQCSKCSCKFITNLGLQRHKVKHHRRVGSMQQRLSKKLGGDLYDQKNFSKADDEEEKSSFKECNLCHLQVYGTTRISQHQQNCHFHDGTFQCSFCTCKFKTLIGLNRHKRMYHENRKVKSKQLGDSGLNKGSPIVGQMLKTKPVGSKEILVKKAQKLLKLNKQRRQVYVPVVCNLCGCSFSRKQSLKRHYSVAHTNGKFKCRTCSCSFHHIFSLRLHEKWHKTGNKTISKAHENVSPKNDEEDEESNADSQLERHHDDDTGSKKSRKFNQNFLKVRPSNSQKQSLPSTPTKSMDPSESDPNSSTDNAPVSSPNKRTLLHPKKLLKFKFKCDLCGLRFHNIHILTRHTTLAHISGGIPCELCPCSFKNLWALGAHKRVYHSSPSRSVKHDDQKSTPLPTKATGISSVADNQISSGNDSTSKVVDSMNSGESGPNSLRTGSPNRAAKIRAMGVVQQSSSSSEEPDKSQNLVRPQLPFQCSLCVKSFASERMLVKHFLSHTKPEACNKCGQRFRNKDEVSKHKTTHHGSGQFECAACSCRFSTEIGRKKHISIMHKVRVGESDRFSNNNNFVIEHEQQDEFEDDEPYLRIDSTFSQFNPSTNTENSGVEDESEPIVEGILNTNYSSNVLNGEAAEENNDDGMPSYPSYFIDENDDDEDDEPIVERVVYNGISRSSTSRLEADTSVMPPPPPPPKKDKHFSPKYRPMKCGTCGLTCLGPEKLREHMQSHNNVQENGNENSETVALNSSEQSPKLKCDSCGNEFVTSGELTQHLQIEHSGGLYQCIHCPCTMKTESNLRYHFVKYHGLT